MTKFSSHVKISDASLGELDSKNEELYDSIIAHLKDPAKNSAWTYKSLEEKREERERAEEKKREEERAEQRKKEQEERDKEIMNLSNPFEPFKTGEN